MQSPPPGYRPHPTPSRWPDRSKPTPFCFPKTTCLCYLVSSATSRTRTNWRQCWDTECVGIRASLLHAFVFNLFKLSSSIIDSILNHKNALCSNVSSFLRQHLIHFYFLGYLIPSNLHIINHLHYFTQIFINFNIHAQ